MSQSPPDPWSPQPPPAPAPADPAWQQWAVPGSRPPRFDPADPLISDDYAGWWRRSLTLLGASWRKVALLQLGLLITVLIATIPADILLEQYERSLEVSDSTTFRLDSLREPGLALLLSLLAQLVYLFGGVASILLLVTIVTGDRPTVGAALSQAVRRIPALLGWNALAGLIIIAALLACLLPVVYVAAVFAVLPVVIALERTNACRRCFQLFNTDLGASVGRVATLFGAGLFLGIVLGVLGVVAPALIQSGATSPDTSIAVGVVTALLEALSYFLIGVIGTPFILTAYADMRARREPFTTAHLTPSPHQVA